MYLKFIFHCFRHYSITHRKNFDESKKNHVCMTKVDKILSIQRCLCKSREISDIAHNANLWIKKDFHFKSTFV